MMAQTTKPRQKRLDSCILALPKWAKIHEKLEKPDCGTLKIDDLVVDTVVRVETALKNPQVRCNTKLLLKSILILMPL
jgi:hypothetical protein